MPSRTHKGFAVLGGFLLCTISSLAIGLITGQPPPPEPMTQSAVQESISSPVKKNDVSNTQKNADQNDIPETALTKTSEELSGTPPPRKKKKKKKKSPINRLRQLYFLPLLHPLGGKH